MYDNSGVISSSTNGDHTFNILSANVSLKTDLIDENTLAAGVTVNTNLKTDDVNERTLNNGVSMDGTIVKDGAVTFVNGATALNRYQEVDTTLDFSGAFTFNTVNVKLSRIGRTIFFGLDGRNTGVAGATDKFTSTALPVDFRPSMQHGILLRVFVNGAWTTGLIDIKTTGVVDIWANEDRGNFTVGQSCGWDDTTFVYYI